MRNGIDSGWCLSYARLSYRRKYLRQCWSNLAVLSAILLLQVVGWLPGLLAWLGFPHSERIGWIWLGVSTLVAVAQVAHARRRWVKDQRQGG